ncbi:RNA polymerase factor sigma-54 [Virgibacillus siamensis]|uniref:RNA polymerase factor sigma-54 n=1 Tax=Virgibacillus siamensis TaxID=480071 RepID=UPI00098590AC|nr:RNA polymerase factor sigma-54 [Virgibacillus siamensis]
MKQKLNLEQTLKQKMNQSLLQSINLLQYTGLEMIDYISELSKENPLIEEVNYDYEIYNYKTSNTGQAAVGEINSKTLTMYEQLKSQLYTLSIPEHLKETVVFGIDSLDEDGYLDIELSLWADNCETTIENVQKALTYIQSLEPAGIGARNLKECILLQLDDAESVAFNLIDQHMELLAAEDIPEISKLFAISESEAMEAVEQIKSCHPKPGQLLADSRPDYIIPEAAIYEEDGTWKISFFKWNSPVIEINKDYLDFKTDEKEAAAFLKEKYNQVNWLKKAIAYRSNTLEKVIHKIVEKQRLYFEHGSFMMQPLTLKEIAADLDLHISTVSRAIANKYIQTRNGVFPLKFFLQSGITQQNGKETSSFVIKQLIHELIQHENKRKPLSDQKIKEKLEKQFDVAVARRTIMKYREQLGIPSSTKRK